MLPIDAGATLLPLARATIDEVLGGNTVPTQSLPIWLHETGACFVTLHKNGDLRGCIGTIEAFRPLIQDLMANAVNAATRDPRFPPLERVELNETAIEVSVLSPTQPIVFTNESDALSQLRAGIDGIVLEWRGKKGTFLPQVWLSLPDAPAFLGHLKKKAGLPSDFWADDIKLYRYTVSNWDENDN